MTKEQEITINNIKMFIKSIRSDLVEESGDNQQLADDIETVLNMLKEKSKEIEKKDKIIKLLIEAMNKIEDPEICKYCEYDKIYGHCVNANKCKEGIKKYFERKEK